jgi:membrane-bound serine protease (ClpP class)
VGEVGVARSEVFDDGSVFVHGEYWNAVSDEKIPANSKVEVIAVSGMTLKVRLKEKKEV